MNPDSTNLKKFSAGDEKSTAFSPIQSSDDRTTSLTVGYPFLHHIEPRFNNAKTTIIYKSDMITCAADKAAKNAHITNNVEGRFYDKLSNNCNSYIASEDVATHNIPIHNESPVMLCVVEENHRVLCDFPKRDDVGLTMNSSYSVHPFNPDQQTLPSESIPIIPNGSNNSPKLGLSTLMKDQNYESRCDSLHPPTLFSKSSLDSSDNGDELCSWNNIFYPKTRDKSTFDLQCQIQNFNDLPDNNDDICPNNSVKSFRGEEHNLNENGLGNDLSPNNIVGNMARNESTTNSRGQFAAHENVGQFIMRVVMKKFYNFADKKLGAIMIEPLEKSLAKTLQRGEDIEFDNLLDMMASLSEFCLPSILRSMFVWYENYRWQINQDKILNPISSSPSSKRASSIDTFTSMNREDSQQAIEISSFHKSSLDDSPLSSIEPKESKIATTFLKYDTEVQAGCGLKVNNTSNNPLTLSQTTTNATNILSGIVGVAASLIGNSPGTNILNLPTNGSNNNHLTPSAYAHYKNALSSMISSNSYHVSPPTCNQGSQLNGENQGDKNFYLERKELAVEFIYCRALIQVLPQFEFHPGHDDIYQKLESSIFHHFKTATNFRENLAFNTNNNVTNPNSANQNLIFDLYAEVLGVLAESRFNTVTQRFLQELQELKIKDTAIAHTLISNAIISLLMGIKFIRVKMVPVESLEDCFQFLQILAHFFIETKDKEIKHALAAILVDILVPVAAKIKNEVNLPCIKQFVDTLYPPAMEMLTKKKHAQAIFPLTTCIFCVSQKHFFITNWQIILNICLANLKNKDTKMSRIAFESLYRLLWVYMIRLKGESNSVTQSRLATIVSSLFPKGSKLLIPKDAPLNIFVKIIQFIAQQRLDFVFQEIISELMIVGKGLKIIMPERMSVGLRAFLVIADNLQQKEGEPPMPQNLLSLPSGNTIRKKKVYLNKTLSEQMALTLGISSTYFNPLIKSFETIINVLDVQIGKPFLRIQQNLNKEFDDLLTGDRKLKMELFRTCIAALPRLLQEKIENKSYFADLLIRLTTHADEKMRGLSYQAIQHFFCESSRWRILLIQNFISFVEKNVNDTVPNLIDISLGLINQLISNFKNMLQYTASCKKARIKFVPKRGSHSQENYEASDNLRQIIDMTDICDLKLPFQLIESFAIVTLCQNSLNCRKLAYNLIKDIKIIYEIYGSFNKINFELNVYDVIQQKISLIVERIKNYFVANNCGDVNVPDVKSDFLVFIEFISNFTMDEKIEKHLSAVSTCNASSKVTKPKLQLQELKDLMNQVWIILITSIAEEKSEPKLSFVIRAQCWNLVFSRIFALSQIFDPNFIVVESRASLLRSSVSKKPLYTTERETYKSIWRNYLALACCISPSSHITRKGTFKGGNNKERNYIKFESLLPFNLSPCSSPETVCYSNSDKCVQNQKLSNTCSSITPSTYQTTWDNHIKSNIEFFEILATSIKVENHDIKDAALQALAYISPSALGDFLEYLEPIIKEAFENKQENLRRRKRREILRLHLTQVFELVARNKTFSYTPAREIIFPSLRDDCPNKLPSSNFNDKPSDMLLFYVDGMAKFLLDQIDNSMKCPQSNVTSVNVKANILNINSSDKNEPNVKANCSPNPYFYINLMSENCGEISLKFCSFIVNLISNFNINHHYALLKEKKHLRSQLFYLFCKMSGKVCFQKCPYENKKNSKNGNLTIFEISSLKAMLSVLTAGQVFDPKILEQNSMIYKWLENLVNSPNKEILKIVHESLMKLLLLNPDSIDFHEWMIETTYSAPSSIGKMLFSVMSKSFCLRQQPIEMVPIMTLTFMFIGNFDTNSKRYSTNLLYTLDRQFFKRLSALATDELCLSSYYASKSRTIPSFALFFSTIKIIECFRDLHPELTLHFFSEIVQKIVKSNANNRRLLFKLLIPWLKRLKFKSLYFVINESQHSKLLHKICQHKSNSHLNGRNFPEMNHYGCDINEHTYNLSSDGSKKVFETPIHNPQQNLSMTEETTLFVLNNVFYLNFVYIMGEHCDDLKEMWKALLCPKYCDTVTDFECDRCLNNLICILEYAMTIILYMSSCNLPYLFSTLRIVVDALQSLDNSWSKDYIDLIVSMFFKEEDKNKSYDYVSELSSYLVISMNYLVKDLNRVEKSSCPPFFRKNVEALAIRAKASKRASSEYSNAESMGDECYKSVCQKSTLKKGFSLDHHGINDVGDKSKASLNCIYHERYCESYYFPMPPYGGYYAPLGDYFCEESSGALYQIERFMLGILVLNQTFKHLEMPYEWNKILHKLFHFTILGMDNSNLIVRQNCEEMLLHITMKQALYYHFPLIANQLAQFLISTYISDSIEKDIKRIGLNIFSFDDDDEEISYLDESLAQSVPFNNLHTKMYHNLNIASPETGSLSGKHKMERNMENIFYPVKAVDNNWKRSCNSLISESTTITSSRVAELDTHNQLSADDRNLKDSNSLGSLNGGSIIESEEDYKERFYKHTQSDSDVTLSELPFQTVSSHKKALTTASELTREIVKIFKNRIGNSVWAYEDITPKTKNLSSTLMVKSLVKQLCSLMRTFQQSATFQEKWRKFSLNFGLICPIRHYACRSLQIYRSFEYPHLNSLALTDIINRIAEVTGEHGVDMNGYFIEMMLTLENCSKHILFSLYDNTPLNCGIRRNSNIRRINTGNSSGPYNSNKRHTFPLNELHVHEIMDTKSPSLCTLTNVIDNHETLETDQQVSSNHLSYLNQISVKNNQYNHRNKENKPNLSKKNMSSASYSAKVAIVSRIYWLSVGLLESDFEHEYYSGIKLLNFIFQNGLIDHFNVSKGRLANNNLDKTTKTTKSADEFDASLEKIFIRLKWSNYKGLLPLIFKGFFSHLNRMEEDLMQEKKNEIATLTPKTHIKENGTLTNDCNEFQVDGGLSFYCSEIELVNLLSSAILFSTYTFVNANTENSIAYTDKDTLIQAKIKESFGNDVPHNVIDLADIPKAMIILFVYMIRAYNDPDDICMKASENIIEFCRKFPNQEALNNLAVLMGAYKERTFTKSCFQWTKCIINYLIQAFPAENYALLLFSYEFYEKGPRYLQSFTCDIIYNLITLVQMTDKASDFLKANFASFVMDYMDPLLYNQILRIIKLVIKKTASLDAPKNLSLKKWEGLTTTSFIDINVLFPRQQLPGPTLNFDVDILFGSMVDLNAAKDILQKKEQVDNRTIASQDSSSVMNYSPKGQESDFIRRKNQVNSLLSISYQGESSNSSLQKGGHFKPSPTNWALYTWKKGPHSSQERVKERLVNLLQAFGRNAFIPKTPSMVFGPTRDIESNCNSYSGVQTIITSTDSVSLINRYMSNNIDNSSKVSSKDDISSNFTENFAGALKDFDFLDIELEKLQDDEINVYDLDNFHWAGLIRHQSMYANYPCSQSSKFSFSTCSSSMLAHKMLDKGEDYKEKLDIPVESTLAMKNIAKSMSKSISCLLPNKTTVNLELYENNYTHHNNDSQSSLGKIRKNPMVYETNAKTSFASLSTSFIKFGHLITLHHVEAGLLFSCLAKNNFKKLNEIEFTCLTRRKETSLNSSMQSFCSTLNGIIPSSESIDSEKIDFIRPFPLITMHHQPENKVKDPQKKDVDTNTSSNNLRQLNKEISQNSLNNFNDSAYANSLSMPKLNLDQFEFKNLHLYENCQLQNNDLINKTWSFFMQYFVQCCYEDLDDTNNICHIIVKFFELFPLLYASIKNELMSLQNILVTWAEHELKRKKNLNYIIPDLILDAFKNLNQYLMSLPCIFIGINVFPTTFAKEGRNNKYICEFILQFQNCVIELHEHYENYLDKLKLFIKISNKKSHYDEIEIREFIKILPKLYFQLYLIASTFSNILEPVYLFQRTFKIEDISIGFYVMKHYMYRFNLDCTTKKTIKTSLKRRRSYKEQRNVVNNLNKVYSWRDSNNIINALKLTKIQRDLPELTWLSTNFENDIDLILYKYSKLIVGNKPSGIVLWPSSIVSPYLMQKAVVKLTINMKFVAKHPSN